VIVCHSISSVWKRRKTHPVVSSQTIYFIYTNGTMGGDP
jgi:hypothetical protein